MASLCHVVRKEEFAVSGDLAKYARDIEAARDAVAKAQLAYSRGGSPEAVVKAERNLHRAHIRYQECSGGIVPDSRE
jgi:hypothetical protein